MEKIFTSLYSNHEKSIFNFKNKFPYDKRYEEAYKIKLKYPDRIPVICQMAGKNIPDLDRKKYLVPDDLTIGQFMYVIRKHIKLSPEMGIYIFIGEDSCIPNNMSLMSSIYNEYCDEDGFLYIKYSGENTFG